MTSPCPMGDAADKKSHGDIGKQADAAAAAAAAATAAAAAGANGNHNNNTIVVSLLYALTSSDNSARNQAEQAFNGLKEGQPQGLVYGLLEGIGSKHLPPHVRGLAAVLLRRALLVDEPSLWDSLPAAADTLQDQTGTSGVRNGGHRKLQACLLQILSDEGDASVRRKVGDLVGELGRAVLDEDGPEAWPEFLPYILQSASWSSSSGAARVTATGPNDAAAATPANNGVAMADVGAALDAAESMTVQNQSLEQQQVQLQRLQLSGGGKEREVYDPWARVVTGLRLMSSAAQHTAVAAAADSNAFRALLETLERCLCWQEKVVGDGRGGSPDVRLEAVRALGSVVVSCERPSDQAALSACLPHLLQAIQATLSSADRNTENGVWYCCETLELVIELAEVCPTFLRPMVSQCVGGMVQVAGDLSMETSVRHLALEFLVSIVEASPAMCRKMGGGGGAGDGSSGAFATSVIPVCFSMMTELPENTAWAMGETEEEDSVEDNVCEVGSEALERVAQALGSRTALPVCRRLIKDGMKGWTWQHQHAALSALGILADVFNQPQGEEGLEMRTEALSQLLPFVACPTPRVQHAALWSLERMAEDQSPELQEEHHEAIVPALLGCIDPANGGCPRVLHRALLTLAMVVEACPQGGVMPHAEALLERCVLLIRQGPLMVQEAAVALVSAAAEAGQEEFGRFYDVVMPFLMQILSSCPGAEQRLLRGKALECVSLVGATVGKERFGVDALSVMQLMVQAQASGLDDDDPTRVYMLRAWVRICKCLGPDFVPYLPLLMPPLLASASANVEVELPSGGDDSDGADVDELDSDVDCMEGLDGEVVAVRTWALEEQATACQMILLLAEALQEHFLPYVEVVAGQLARLVNTSPHDDVRRTFCMAAMPELVRACGKAAVMPGSELEGGRVRQLLEFCLCRLLESLDKEEDAELLMTAAQACKRCVYYACVRWEMHTEGMGDPTDPRPAECRRVLNEEQSRALATAALGCLGKSLRRRALRRADATASEDWDEEEEERAQAAGEEEVELHVNLAELLGFLFKTHGEAFFLAFEELLLPSVLEMARPDSLAEDRKVAVHVLDHALEFANPAACVMLPSTIPLLLDACSDQAPSVSLPALFGIGVSAATYGPAFSPFAVQSVQVLVEVILRPGAREVDRELATDNAVSALGNVLEAQRYTLSSANASAGAPGMGTGVGGVEGVGRAWELWLRYMPLRADDEEAEKVAHQLCRMLTASSMADAQAVLGSRLERLPAALTALAEMAGSELVGPDVRQQVGQTILTLQSGGRGGGPRGDVPGVPPRRRRGSALSGEGGLTPPPPSARRCSVLFYLICFILSYRIGPCL
ncbi:unnamed protein product [Pylaiella littoralis]